MKLITWDIDSGGKNNIYDILDKINKEDCDIAVITGFRLNHNKNIILKGLRDIGYANLLYKKPFNSHQDTVLIASREGFDVIKNNSFKKDSFLIIKVNDLFIASMNFTNSITQKDLMNLFAEELNEFKDKKLIVTGNMQTAKNYATENSLGKKQCKKYMDFKVLGLNNCMENSNIYTWDSRKGGEYNVDFILANDEVLKESIYCYYNSDVKDSKISTHCMIITNIY